MGRSTWAYLGSYSLSLLGNGVASVLFPLLVLAQTGDILAAGILASVTAAVAAVVGVLAGVIVDLVNRRTVSIVSDVLSAVSVAALPVVDALWGLNLTWFIVLGVLGSFGDMPGMTARETLLPRLVELDGGKPGALDRLVGVREALAGALVLVGPGLGGLLVWLVGVNSATLFITAGMSVAAALLSFAMSPRAGEVNRRDGAAARAGVRTVVADLVAGWRFLLGHRLVLGVSMLSAVLIAVIVALQTTIMPAYFTGENLPEFSGFAAMGIAAGSLVSAVIYAATVGKVSRRTWFVVGMVGVGIGFTVIGLLAAPWLVLAAAVFIGLTNGPMSAVLGVATIEATPDQLRGRVLGVQNALMLAAPALTAAPIAAIASGRGLEMAGIGLAVVIVLTVIVALCAPAFRSLDRLNPAAEAEG
ncbi:MULTISPECIES: MFS transporter [Micromonospora]|uniref:Multidrug efflux pump Tap n=2 Tax=Micromonospora TaxID=1873 RepID=A0A9X0I783_9ACTN|nr:MULTISPECIES: MFS transporter [Micromonospora]AEB42777.1 major facilitator superfamily MFS_1 [Micromonospora maris AB-18-032]KUJ48191.1 MFS transporter [Micromonospora maris]RUL92586.1 MFS transporter [Verrucosispora sp. FIM060022]